MPAEPLSPIFAGREREVALINGLASRAFGEDPVVVLVGGDAGVGKTRADRRSGSSGSPSTALPF